MTRHRTIRSPVWAMALAVILIVASVVGLYLLRHPRSNPVTRGWELAGNLGCFSCHGPGGRGGVANPGSEEGEIPAWDGGMLMMYVQSEEEIAEWILDGRPARLRDSRHDHSASQQVSMPAYSSRLSSRDLEDLVELVKTIGKYDDPTLPTAARKGREVASRLGCFGCHRLGGLLGTPNPGSLKGYIPPWRGQDFQDLVRDREELESWILEGEIERLRDNPVADFFTRRQIIQMPAYRSRLEQGDLEALLTYIEWLQGGRPSN